LEKEKKAFLIYSSSTIYILIYIYNKGIRHFLAVYIPISFCPDYKTPQDYMDGKQKGIRPTLLLTLSYITTHSS